MPPKKKKGSKEEEKEIDAQGRPIKKPKGITVFKYPNVTGDPEECSIDLGNNLQYLFVATDSAAESRWKMDVTETQSNYILFLII